MSPSYKRKRCFHLFRRRPKVVTQALGYPRRRLCRECSRPTGWLLRDIAEGRARDDQNRTRE